MAPPPDLDGDDASRPGTDNAKPGAGAGAGTAGAPVAATASDGAWLRQVLAALPQRVYVLDLGLQRQVYANRQGLPDLALAARADRLDTPVHPEDLTSVQAHLARLPGLADGQSLRHQFRLRDGDGPWRWFEATDTVLQRHADGRVWQVVGSAVEVSVRQQADAGRLSGDSLLRQVEKAPMAVIEFDADMVVQRWAGEAERLFGWRADEVLGRPVRLLDMVHEDDRGAVNEMVQRLLGGNTAYATLTHRNYTRERRLVHCTWHNSALSDVPGGGMLSLVLDVTQHRAAEEALRASEARHRLLAETLLHGVVHQDAEGHIIAMNPAAERILGKSRERLLGSDSAREDHDSIREDGSRYPGDQHPSMVALASGQPVRGVVMGVWNPRLAERRWIRVDAVPVRPPGQARPVEVYAVFDDITDRRRAERALHEADRQKDLFIATLAHELRNPLAPILHAASLLRTPGLTPSAQDHCSAVIGRQAAQMARLLDDLLDISRVASGRLLLRPERLTLDAVLQQAIETARPLIDAAGHHLSLNLLPQPVVLVGDRLRLAQVCANLLTNAAKYTPAGGQISLSTGLQDGELVIRVRDNGIGLAVEHLDAVFEMFNQVDRSPERAQGGMGIGLALARSLVALHGGRIGAHSAGLGQGSEFTVWLPLGAPAAAQPAPAVAHSAAAAAGRRILVVDDNPDAVDTLAMLLAADGHQVRTARDGLDALAVAEAWQPEVALLDLGMPRLNGYQLCTLLRQQPWAARLMVVAISGWGQAQDRQRSTAAGFDAHLVKPVRLDELSALLAASG